MSWSLPPERSGHDAEAERANSHQLNSEIGVEPWIAERVTELARDGRNRETPRDDQKAEYRGRSPASVKATDQPTHAERTRHREQRIRY